MATLEERVHALETLLSAAAGTAPYNSQHTGPQIDSAISRALPGGEIDITSANNDPRNWGLGSYAGVMPNMSLNDCKANGWYINQGNDAVNCPTINGTIYSYGVVVVITKSLSHIVQVYYPSILGTAMSFVRSFMEGAWTPWDTNNPPMLLGVEYRTTERYMGKPVYCMLVDVGYLPNNDVADIKITGDGLSLPIRADLLFGGDSTTQGTAVGNHYPYIDYFYTGADRIVIKTNADISYTYARVQIWYTKA